VPLSWLSTLSLRRLASSVVAGRADRHEGGGVGLHGRMAGENLFAPLENVGRAFVTLVEGWKLVQVDLDRMVQRCFA
jgi:hypothetical protein